MKYLKYLQTTNDFESFKNSADYVLPNVSYVVETEGVSFEPYVERPFEIEIPSPYAEWARIQHKDGTLYTADEWLAAESAGMVTDADANGVAVLYSRYAVCPHVLYPKDLTQKLEWCTSKMMVDGVTSATADDSKFDVNGKVNTEAILAAKAAGKFSDCRAARWSAAEIFANGQKGYLPAAGELQAWLDNINEIETCMNIIGGVSIKEKSYWSSTQGTERDFALELVTQTGRLGLFGCTKSLNVLVRPVVAFEYSPKNEFSNK